MTVLVADDNSSVRLMLKRLLELLDCDVIEAETGVAALEAISKTGVSLVVLDLRMPLLSGIEVLKAIRSSRRHATLPVVIVSGDLDRETAEEALKLGVVDVLAKPFRFEKFKVRLTSVLRSIRAVEHGAAPLLPVGVRPVVIVDGNAEFRYFVANVLGSRHATMQAESGQQAIEFCSRTRPTGLVVGPDVGLFGPIFLAAKLRSQHEFDDTRLILAASDEEAAALGDTSMFDAIIPRSFVPDEFLRHFHKALARRFSFTDPLSPLAIVRSTVTLATEQAMGMVAHTDLRVAADTPAPPKAGEITASVVLQLFREDTDVHLALTCDVGSATIMAARMLAMEPADIGPDESQSVVGEFINMIAGRVQGAIASEGGSARFTLPEIGLVEAPLPAPDVALRFESGAGDVCVHVAMTASDRRAKAA